MTLDEFVREMQDMPEAFKYHWTRPNLDASKDDFTKKVWVEMFSKWIAVQTPEGLGRRHSTPMPYTPDSEVDPLNPPGTSDQ